MGVFKPYLRNGVNTFKGYFIFCVEHFISLSHTHTLNIFSKTQYIVSYISMGLFSCEGICGYMGIIYNLVLRFTLNFSDHLFAFGSCVFLSTALNDGHYIYIGGAWVLKRLLLPWRFCPLTWRIGESVLETPFQCSVVRGKLNHKYFLCIGPSSERTGWRSG